MKEVISQHPYSKKYGIGLKIRRRYSPNKIKPALEVIVSEVVSKPNGKTVCFIVVASSHLVVVLPRKWVFTS